MHKVKRPFAIHSIIAFIFLFSMSMGGHSALAKQPTPPGGHLNIIEVSVDFNTNTLTIIGEDLGFGAPLVVTLGGIDIGFLTADNVEIVSTINSSTFPPGDYLLTVSTGNGQSQNDEYDLTIGAGGGAVGGRTDPILGAPRLVLVDSAPQALD